MRTTDDLNPERFQPLGEKVAPPKPAEPEWKPKPDSPHIEQNAKGELRTNIPGAWK